MQEHVGVRPHQDADVAVEPVHPTDRVLATGIEGEDALLAPLDGGAGQEGGELVRHADRSGAGTPSPVGRRERLVGVDVHDVEPHVPGPAATEDRVQVGPVVVQEAADAVDRGGDLLDLLLEETERVRVREHQPGDRVVHELRERPHVDEPAGVGPDRHGVEPGQANAGRVRPVGRVRDDHPAPRLTSVLVERPHQQQARHLSAGAGGRLQRRPIHPGDRAEGALQPPQELQDALRRPIRLERMEALESGQRRDGLGDLRVVLHRAGTQGIHPGVEAVVHLRETRVVPDEIDLGDLGQARAARPGRAREGRAPRERRGAGSSTPAGRRRSDRGSSHLRRAVPDSGPGLRPTSRDHLGHRFGQAVDLLLAPPLGDRDEQRRRPLPEEGAHRPGTLDPRGPRRPDPRGPGAAARTP